MQFSALKGESNGPLVRGRKGENPQTANGGGASENVDLKRTIKSDQPAAEKSACVFVIQESQAEDANITTTTI